MVLCINSAVSVARCAEVNLFVEPAAATVTAHFEPCGSIHLSSAPEMAFDIGEGHVAAGSTIGWYVNQPRSKSHRFVRNKDGTLSPAVAPNLVVVVVKKPSCLELAEVGAENALQFELPAELGRSPNRLRRSS